MSDSILLTDIDPQELSEAVQLLDGWEVKQVPADQLARAVGGGADSGFRAVLIESETRRSSARRSNGRTRRASPWSSRAPTTSGAAEPSS